MTTTEKFTLLSETREKLKSEFIGIDQQIDKVMDSITSWFITPDLYERPLIISLWGMTGTGKTSLAKKVLSYLGLDRETIMINCGELLESDKISDFFGDCIDSRQPGDISELGYKNSVFILDEFQYIRTVSETNTEISRKYLSSFWSLIDSGHVTISSGWRLSAGMRDLLSELQCIQEYFEPKKEDPEIVNNVFQNPDQGNGYFSSVKEEDQTSIRTSILDKNAYASLINLLRSRRYSEYIPFFRSSHRMSELISCCRTILKEVSVPYEMDCSGSLIFILGNLDEVYSGCKEINPDASPDSLNLVTSKIGVTKVKEALLRRFRAEQVSRLGNNIICYPSFSSSDFRRLINLEFSRIKNRFKELYNVDVSFGDDLKNVIFSEGIYPSQGVRPVFSTIEILTTKFLSKIIEMAEPEEASLDIDFTGHVTIWTKSKGTYETDTTLDLQNKKNECMCMDKIYAYSVHEISHSIVYTFLNGRVPDKIVASTVCGGGFMDGTQSESDRDEIMTKLELKNKVSVLIAGYLGESLLFSDQNRLMGSGNDIERAWKLLGRAAYQLGYFSSLDPILFTSNLSSPFSEPSTPGFLDTRELGAAGNTTLQGLVYQEFKGIKENVISILQKETELLKQASLKLAETRIMDSTDFSCLVDKYGSPELRQAKKKNKENYWKSKIDEL